MEQIGTQREHLVISTVDSDASLHKLGLPVDSLLDCITDAVSMLDSEWRYVYVNATAERIAGLGKAQLIGKSLWELFPGAIGTEFEIQARHAMAEERPVTFEYYFPTFGRWYEQRLYPTKTGLLFLTTDIDERKRLDQQVREGEALYKHLFEVTNDGILIVDDQGRYVDVNGSYCRFLKTTRERIIGAHFAEFISPDRLDEAVGAFADLKAGKPTPIVFPLRAVDGSIVELEWNSYPHYLANLSFCICRNRTEARSAQAALQSAEERQRRAVEAGGVGLWEWDIQKNKVTWSDYIYHLHGLQPGTFDGTVEAFAALVDPRDQAMVSAALNAALSGKRDYSAEFRAKRTDGMTRWLQTSGRVTFNDDGRAAVMHGAVIDTTERKLAEEAQLLSEQQLMLLVEASGALLASPHSAEVLHTIVNLAQRFIAADAHAVWHEEENGSWKLRSSAGLSSSFAEEATAGQGSSVVSILSAPMVVEDVTKEQRLEGRRKVLAREGVCSMLVVPLRVHGTPSGTVVFYWKSPHKFEDSEIRIASALGNLAASALSTAELYERQLELRGEAESAERRARFLAEAGALLSSSLDHDTTLARVATLAIPAFADWASVDLVTEDGQLRRISVVHRDPEKIRFANEFAKRYPPREDDLVTIALRTGKSTLIEEVTDELIVEKARDEEHLRIVRELGLKSVIVAPMLLGGRTIGILSFVTAESSRRYNATDLQTAEELARRATTALDNARLYDESRRAQTDLQRANEELSRANDDLNQFAYSASHDLQEPLRMIQSYGELLKRRYAEHLGTGDAREYIGYIIQGAERLETLLRAIRVYTQTVHAPFEECDPVNATKVLRSALANLERSIGEADAEISFKELPAVRVKEVHLTQLFQNLIGNAIKYRALEPPRIELTARPDGSNWLFAVKDNGIGIDAEYSQEIFTLFKRLHSPEEYPGTGVGLAICQKVVERYGGRIWVESAIGRGSTFYFTLPK